MPGERLLPDRKAAIAYEETIVRRSIQRALPLFNLVADVGQAVMLGRELAKGRLAGGYNATQNWLD